MVTTARTALLALVAVLAFGCRSERSATREAKPEPAAPEPKPEPEPRPKVESAPRPSPPPREGVLLAIVDGALVRLDGHRARRFEGAAPIHGLRRDHQDRIQAIRGRELVELVETGLEPRARVDAEIAAPVSAVWLGPGRAWSSSPSGVSGLDGEAWTTTALAELEFDAAPELGVDGSGRVWLVGPQRVLYRDGDDWSVPEVPPIPPSFALGHPRTSALGPVHVNNDHRLTRLAPTYFDSVLVDPRAQLDYEFLALAPTGHALLATADCELGRVPPSPPTRIWRFAAADYACARVSAVAIDAQLRIWVASDRGLSEISASGRVVEHPRASVAAIDGEISELLVLGPGPNKLVP